MLDLRDHDDLLVLHKPDMKCLSLHINENYRGLVVRKLKPMDWDRIRIFLEVARTGMRVNRQRMDADRAGMIHSVFPDVVGGPDEEARKHGIVSGRRVLQKLMKLRGGRTQQSFWPIPAL
jgi:hypothetical protein